MNRYIPITLVVLFVTTFTFFLGWVPMVGVAVPQLILVGVTILMCPMVISSRAALWFYVFFAIRLIVGLVNGSSFDIIEQTTYFTRMALPIYISTYLFTKGNAEDVKLVSKFALIITFITLLLSVRVLMRDNSALRMTSYANSIGEAEVFMSYWREGMADYSMAAMTMFMPAVLIYLLRQTQNRRIQWLIIAGILTSAIFLYLGQVTAPFIIGIIMTFFALFEKFNKISFIVPAILLGFLLMNFLDSILGFAISSTDGSIMNEKFVAISDLSSGNSVNEASDLGIRISLLTGTISTFLSHPLFGDINGQYGGHNFFLDLLAKYGIIGSLPFYMMIFSQCKFIFSSIPDRAKNIFRLIIIGFVFHGLIKNMSGFDYWSYLYIYYPCILIWGTKEESETSEQYITA